MLSFLTVLQALITDRVRTRDDEGATAVEYGLMVALIAAIIVGTVALLGGEINGAFQDVLNAITGEDDAA